MHHTRRETRYERWSLKWTRRIEFVRFTEIATIVVTIVAIIVLVGPVRGLLQDRDVQRFEAEAALIQSEIHELFELHSQLSMQLPSRTRIREELLRYDAGEITREEYSAFTDAKLADAIVASEEILSVFRYHRSGTLVASANLGEIDPPALESPFDAVVNPDRVVMVLPASLEDSQDGSVGYYFAIAPIAHGGSGTIGYDFVAISFDGVFERLSQISDRIQDTDLFLYYRPTGTTIISISEEGDGGPSFRYDLEVGWNWHIGIQRSRDDLFGQTDRDIRLLTVVALVLGLLLFGFARWAANALSRRARDENAELTAIVEEQTEQLRRLLGERDLLLREVHHRIKNDMSMVRSLMSLQRNEAHDQVVKDLLAEAESRVGLMAEIYDLLYRSDDFGTVEIRPVLENLLCDVVASHAPAGGNRGIDLDLSIIDAPLPRRIAAPIGMVANELVINALKYAFLDGIGTIQVTLGWCDSSPERLALSVEDSGPGIPGAVKEGTYGFGFEMIYALIAEYDGTVSFPHSDGGGVVRVELNVPQNEQETPGRSEGATNRDGDTDRDEEAGLVGLKE